jgi:hypothetical protein
MRPARRELIALLAAVTTICGCTPTLSKGKLSLAPAQMSPDSVGLELFFVRCPFGDPDVNTKLWQEIDEQHLPADLRERLARNGFRAGVVSGQVPVELSKLLELSDKPPSGPASGSDSSGAKVNEQSSEPLVVRRHLQLRAAQRSEIIASSIYPHLPVLVWESGQVSGRTYDDAQGIFAAKSFPQPDGRVRLQLVPELHHDQAKERWVGSQGVFRLETNRPKKVFEDLTLTADLSPGAMLVLTSLPNRQGSLGHHFFTENNGRLEQKLLVIRLSQTQHDGLFVPPEPLRLDQQ